MQFSHSKLLLAVLLTFFVFVHSRPTQKFNHFQYGVRLVPHPKKVHKGGEDAFFVNENMLAVADGVGSWNSKGVDPSKYSKEFCKLIGVLLNENYTNYINKPKAIIQEAAKRNTNNGTSTIVIASLDKTRPILRTSYVGDSIYIIYRKQDGVWKSIFEAAVHQFKFNSPYQLGYKRGAPRKALEFEHEVQDKDIILVGSDGIFDNLTSDQILAELIKFIGKNDELKEAQKAAHNITEAAYKLSLNRSYMAPFRIKAAIANYTSTAPKGGKSDDITAAVGQIRIVNNNGNQNAKGKINSKGNLKNLSVNNKTQEKNIVLSEL